jgi:hypothetical protein
MVLTDIEKLGGRYPHLVFCVKAWLDQGTASEKIAALLQETFGVCVTRTVVENYRYKRWVPEKTFIALKSATKQSVINACGGDAGLDTAAMATLWELMDEMTIPQLLSARALFVKIKAQNLKEQEFLFKSGQLKPHKSPEEEEADRNAQSRNALRRMKEIFGLAGDGPPKPKVLAPAVKVGA